MSESNNARERLVHVTGKGRLLVKPDYIRVSMRLSSEAKEYDKAMLKASERLESLTKALGEVGFGEDDVKTSEFSVDATHEYQNKFGKSKKVETGFAVKQRVNLGFDMDLDRLSRTLAVIAQWSTSEPDLSVKFTVKDPSGVRDAVLQAAAKNARRQAEVLCEASGVKLGALVKVDYSCTDVNFVSVTTYDAGMSKSFSAMRNVSYSLSVRPMTKIKPDEIDVRDSASFTWAIG